MNAPEVLFTKNACVPCVLEQVNVVYISPNEEYLTLKQQPAIV